MSKIKLLEEMHFIVTPLPTIKKTVYDCSGGSQLYCTPFRNGDCHESVWYKDGDLLYNCGSDGSNLVRNKN